MEKSFLVVVALGAAVGLLWPSGRHVASVPATAVASAPPSVMAMETKLARMPNGHFYADASVNGQPVRLVVDTGASMVALTMADAQRIGVPFSPAEFMVIGTGASGPVRGKPVMLDRVAVGTLEVRSVPAAVVEGLDVSLLGQTYLSRLSAVEMAGDTMTFK